jgi:hypothetical protein
LNCSLPIDASHEAGDDRHTPPHTAIFIGWDGGGGLTDFLPRLSWNFGPLNLHLQVARVTDKPLYLAWFFQMSA